MLNDVELVSFKIKLSSQWYRLPCHVIISIDESIVEDTTISEKKSDNESKVISFERSLPEGLHKLKIQYLGKLPKVDTKLQKDNTIVDDHLLYIEDIEIDDIELGHTFFSKGKFYPDRNIHPDLPEVMDEIICLGYNGTWILDIEVPTYIWFLENL